MRYTQTGGAVWSGRRYGFTPVVVPPEPELPRTGLAGGARDYRHRPLVLARLTRRAPVVGTAHVTATVRVWPWIDTDEDDLVTLDATAWGGGIA